MIDQLAYDISAAIKRAIEETTSRVNICPFSKRWWNKDLTDLRRQAERIRRRFNKYGRQEDKEKWKECRRNYYHKIEECKRNDWQKFVSGADERDIWIVNQYLNSTPTNTYISHIRRTSSNQQAENRNIKQSLLSSVIIRRSQRHIGYNLSRDCIYKSQHHHDTDETRH